MKCLSSLGLLGLLTCLNQPSVLASPPKPVVEAPTIDENGTVHIPNLAVPLSTHLSDEAKRAFVRNFSENSGGILRNAQPENDDHSGSSQRCPGQEAWVKQTDTWLERFIDVAKIAYPVEIRREVIEGVKVDIVVPRLGLDSRNQHRVLIGLHGGGYSCLTTGGLAGLAEAIPIAGSARVQVITVDYRSEPNFRFPAARDDVVAVYRRLLKHYRAENIGIFGCSTGATLTANVVAWLQKERQPLPAAIGLFCEGATKDDHVDGDGWFVNTPLNGGNVLAPNQSYQVLYPEAYMRGTSEDDPLVAPVNFPKVLAKFPPTLVMSGTRDIALSEAIYTHTQLVKAGADAELHVWEGMWHGFFIDVSLPESKEFYDVVKRFFDKHLGISAKNSMPDQKRFSSRRSQAANKWNGPSEQVHRPRV